MPYQLKSSLQLLPQGLTTLKAAFLKLELQSTHSMIDPKLLMVGCLALVLTLLRLIFSKRNRMLHLGIPSVVGNQAQLNLGMHMIARWRSWLLKILTSEYLGQMLSLGLGHIRGSLKLQGLSIPCLQSHQSLNLRKSQGQGPTTKTS